MNVKLVTACVILLHFLEPSKGHIPVNNLDIQPDCRSICTSSGSQPEYSFKDKICNCFAEENIDGIDATLFNKNAELISTNVNKKQHNGKENKMIIKREITTTEQTLEETTPTNDFFVTTTLSSDKEIDINPEGIVGQQPPRRQPHRLVTPRSHDRTRPITVEQQRLIVQQIHDHLHRLTQTTDTRLREIEIEAIRSNLRQLTQTHVIQPPQYRARMRTTEETRRRQQTRHRIPHSRLVGASGPQFEENLNITKSAEVTTTPVKNIFASKKRHFEIITQDPRLIDE